MSYRLGCLLSDAGLRVVHARAAVHAAAYLRD